MSVPANFKSAIESKRLSVRRWLEIEGIPYGYGTFSQSSSFFSARAAVDRFLGVKAQLRNIPQNLDQQVDTLDGGSLTTGQVDFHIVDNDGQPTLWTALGNTSIHLAEELDTTETTITVTGVISGFVAGDYIYIGTETIQIGGVTGQDFTGCTRGMFRSRPQAFGFGTPVGSSPYTMAHRRCWYNEVAVDLTDPTSTLTSTDPDRCVRFSGLLRNLRLADGQYQTYVLTAESMDRELDRPCFRTLRGFNITENIKDAQGRDGTVQVTGYPGWSYGYDLLYNMNLGDWPTIPEVVLLRIDDEIFEAIRKAGSGLIPGSIQLSRRGLFGTKIVKHEEGAWAQEVTPLYRFEVGYNSGLSEVRASKFQSLITANAPLQADHPLMLLLQILLSTGTGTNTPGGGARNYDVLPEGWGMAVDVDRVDVAGIEAAALEEPTLKFSGIVEKPISFLEFARSTLRMCGYYYLVEIGDKFTIRRLRPPYPDVETTAITNNKRIRNFFTRWEANWSGAIKEVIFRFGWDIVDEKFKRNVVLVLGDGDVYSKGLARSLVLESKFLYPGKSGIVGELAAEAFDVNSWLLTRGDFYKTRYARPPPIITERVDYSFLDLEVGDLVDVTHSALPNPADGTRGVTNQVGEIVSKSIDDISHTVLFGILLTGWKLGYTRFIAPAMKITNDAGGGFFDYAENQFTDPTGPFKPSGVAQNDGLVQGSDGVAAETLPTGTECWLYTSDFTSRIPMTVLSVDTVGLQIELDPHGVGDISDVAGVNYLNGFLVLKDYQTVKDTGLTPRQETVWAFMADANETLGSDSDAAHQIFPL